MANGAEIGRTKEGDCYETPEWALLALLKREGFEGKILEPCSGKGSITNVLRKYGYEVYSSDIRNEDVIVGEKNKDAFSINTIYDNIVTNPPYSIINKLVEHFSSIYTKKMALLLRLSFLESQGRFNFLYTYPLKVVYVFSSRVTMYPEDEKRPNNSGTVAYAWFVWEKGYTGAPVIQWINEKETNK